MQISSPFGTLAGGLLAIAVTAAILLTGASTIKGRTGGSGEVDFVLETPETVPDFEAGEEAGTFGEEMPFEDPGDRADGNETAATASDTAAEAGKGARQVAPGSFSLPADVQSQPLERIEPRETVREDEAESRQAASTVLPRPVPVSSGEIRFGDRTLALEGIDGLAVNRTCVDAGGKNWPCGMMARTALRNFIRGRALTCTVPDAAWTGTVTARCDLAGQDISRWLVENGWAVAAAGSDLAQTGEDAEAGKRGFYGEDPRRGAAATPLPDPVFQDTELPE